MIDDVPEDIKSNQQHLPHTTFLILQNMQPNYPEPMQTFFSTFWLIYCTCQIYHV